MCAEMVTMNRGLSEDLVVRTTVPFFKEKLAEGIFADMQALVLDLHARLRSLGGVVDQRVGHQDRHEALWNRARARSRACGRSP